MVLKSSNQNIAAIWDSSLKQHYPEFHGLKWGLVWSQQVILQMAFFKTALSEKLVVVKKSAGNSMIF